MHTIVIWFTIIFLKTLNFILIYIQSLHKLLLYKELLNGILASYIMWQSLWDPCVWTEYVKRTELLHLTLE